MSIYLKPLKVAWQVLLIFIFAASLFLSETVADATYNALLFCGRTIIPSMYIYIILSRRIAASRWVTRLCGTRFCGLTVIALGMLCGFPTGALNCVELYKRGIISRKKAEYLCCLCSFPSMSFVLVSAGGVLGGMGEGAKMLLCLIASAAITAVLLYPVMREKGKTDICLSPLPSESLTQTVTESAFLMVKISGFIIIFSVLGVVASRFLPLPPLWKAFVLGLFEFSSGVYSTSDFPTAAPALCGLFLGFGSFSAICQTCAVMEKHLSTRYFLVSRLLMAGLTALLSMLT